MTHFYFAYGANTNLDGMRYRCPNATRIGNAFLNNHRLCFRSYADVVPDTKNLVIGVLWQIDDSDLKSLDRFEGYPHYYSRRIMEVNFNDSIFTAWVYIMNDQVIEVDPDSMYFAICLSGYIENDLDTSQLYKALTKF